MLPPEDYQRAALEADYHVQMLISSFTFESGEARVTGRVVGVFRGHDELCGSNITLNINYSSDDDWAPDGLGRIPIELLQVGRVLEAYVNATPSGFEVALDLYILIDSATDSPKMEGGQLDDCRKLRT